MKSSSFWFLGCLGVVYAAAGCNKGDSAKNQGDAPSSTLGLAGLAAGGQPFGDAPDTSPPPGDRPPVNTPPAGGGNPGGAGQPKPRDGGRPSGKPAVPSRSGMPAERAIQGTWLLVKAETEPNDPEFHWERFFVFRNGRFEARLGTRKRSKLMQVGTYRIDASATPPKLILNSRSVAGRTPSRPTEKTAPFRIKGSQLTLGLDGRSLILEWISD